MYLLIIQFWIEMDKLLNQNWIRLQKNILESRYVNFLNYDLNTFFHSPKTQKGSYDIIFSTSVIEHVEDDDLFFAQFVELLKPNGIGILTCDFKNDYVKGDFVFSGNYRFYSNEDLTKRILPSLKNV